MGRLSMSVVTALVIGVLPPEGGSHAKSLAAGHAEALAVSHAKSLAVGHAEGLPPGHAEAFPQSQQAGRITRIEFRPATVDEGGGVFITLVGAGRCSYTIDFGDGSSERRTAELPDRMQHKYPADGEYLVVATPEDPCQGVARAKLDVRAINRGVWGLSAEPGTATPEGVEVVVSIAGRGECVVTLDFGDGTIERVEGPLPARRSHLYEKTGTYELRAVAHDPCRGEATLKLEVSRN